ncbi:hypothetical protein G9A89_001066 [Geosiphon pyriformis]|nr:hypothetical protein G9A89_001066 [Geosiphon pyriformis]
MPNSSVASSINVISEDSIVKNEQALYQSVKEFFSNKDHKFYIAISAALICSGIGLYYYGFSKSPRPKTRKPKRGKTSKGSGRSSLDGKAPSTSEKGVRGKAIEEETEYDNLSKLEIEALPQEKRSKAAQLLKARGNKAYADKDYERAAALYTRAIEFYPDPVFYSNRAACYYNIEAFFNVIEDCDKALQLDPFYIKALNRRAAAYEQTQQYQDALNDYTASCILDKLANNTTNKSMDRILNIIAQSKAQELMKVSIILVLVSKLSKPFNKVLNFFTLSIPLSEHQKAKLSIISYLKSTDKDEKADDNIEQESSEKKLAPYLINKDDTVLENDTVYEADGDAFFKRGQKLLRGHKYPEAQTAFRKAIELGCSHMAEAHEMRGTFVYLQGDTEDALKDYNRAILLNPQIPGPYIKRATIFMEQGNISDALHDFEEATKVNPKNPNIYYHRGQVHFITGNFQEAIKDYEQSIAINGDFLLSYIQLAVAQYKIGAIEDSIEAFEQSLKKFPQSAEIHTYYGEVLLDQQRFEDAMEHFDKAIELQKDNPLHYVNKGLAEFQRQDPVQAEELCREALKVDPESDVANPAMAQILLQAGKTELALKYIEKCIEIARTEQELVAHIQYAEAAKSQLLDTTKSFLFEYKTANSSGVSAMKKYKKKSISGFAVVNLSSKKKRKGGLLKKSLKMVGVSVGGTTGNSAVSENGDTTELESVNMEEEFLVEETSFQLGSGEESGSDDVEMTPKGPKRIITKCILGKPLGTIDFGKESDNNSNVLDESVFLLSPLLPKSSIQVSVCKSFALDIDLVNIAEKSSQEKLIFVRKIFFGVNDFGEASTLSKFGGIIWAIFTSEKAIIAAANLANEHGIVVNTDLKRPVNNCMNWAIVLKEIPVGTSIEAVHMTVSEFGVIRLIKMQLSILIGKNAVRVARVDINKQLWETRDSFRTLLYTLSMRTTTHDFSKVDLVGAMAATPVIKNIGLCWSHFSLASCTVCKNYGHTSFNCRLVKSNVVPGSRKAPLLVQNQVRLAKIYAKKSAPISCPLAFGGKTWALVAGAFSALPFSGSKLCLGSIVNGRPTLPVANNLERHLVNIESSFVSLVGQIGKLAKRLDSLMSAVSQPNSGCQLPVTLPSQNPEDDIVMSADLNETTSDETALVVDLSVSPYVIKLENMLESLSRSVLSLSAHFKSLVLAGGCVSFKKCLDLGLVNYLVRSLVAKKPTWANSKGVEKTIDYVFVSSNLVNALVHHNVFEVSKHFDMDYLAVSVSLGLGELLDIATLVNVAMFLDEFAASVRFSDLDAMWRIVSKIMVFLANKVFKKKWFKDFNKVFFKESSRFYKLELLVSKIIRVSCEGNVVNFVSFIKCRTFLNSVKASVIQDLVNSGVDSGHVHFVLSSARKSYHAFKLVESQIAKETNIRSTINKRIESFEINKSHTIRSVLEHPFCKMVLNHLVINNELILEPDLVKTKYVFDEAFSGVISQIGYNKLFGVVFVIPDGKAAGLLDISNKLWKHCNKLAWVSMIPKSYKWEDVLTNTCPIVLIETAHKIFSKVLSDRISAACSAFDGITTQSFIFAIGSVIENALEKNYKLWLVLQDMQKAYDSVGWEHLEKSLVRIKMCSKFIQFFGNIYRDCTNRIITDFGLTGDYQESVCAYRLNSCFISKSGCAETQVGLSSFFAVGAFAATQHILNVASEFFRINDISINNNKTVAILINSRVSNPSLSISGSPISIAKKGEFHQYLGIFFLTESLSKPSLAKAHSDVCFFINLVLKKAISDKQFSYLVSTVLQPIVSYQTQFSFILVGVCNRWNALICKGLKYRSGFSLNFPSDTLHHPSFYGLKSFSQVQSECKIASFIGFVNSSGILGHLFSHRSYNLQVHAFNNFLAGMVRILLDCGLSLGGFFVSSFRFCSSVLMSAVLDKSRFFKFLPSLWQFGIAFVDQLHDCYGALATAFLNVVSPLSSNLHVLGGCQDIFGSSDFVSVCNHFFRIGSGLLSIYTNGSLRNLGTAGCRAGAAAFFEDIGSGLGVGVSGLMLSTLVELQAIVLALECVPSSSSVHVFSDSQSALSACKSEMGLMCLDFCNQYWVKHCYIANIVCGRNLRVDWHKVKSHSGVSGNECANTIVGAASLSCWRLCLCLNEHFLVADGKVVSDNSRHFVGSGSKLLKDSLLSDVDWLHSSRVWHSDLHMAIGFTSRPSANVCTYFMKTLHHQLPIAVRKGLYSKCYSNVLCLYCGDVESSDHVFFCKTLSGLSLSSSVMIQLLLSCAFNFLVSMALCKGFVFNNWFCKAVSIFHNPKISGLEVVKFVHSLGLAFRDDIWLVRVRYCAHMERTKLILLDSSAFVLVSGLALGFSASVVKLLGIAKAVDVYFGFRKPCLFFSGISNSVSVYILA